MLFEGLAAPAVTLKHLTDLVADGVREGRTLEFKAALGNSDADRREFLADVSSLANTAGGHYLLGVEEDGGVATAVVGVESDDADSFVLSIENRLRDAIEPRLAGVEIAPVLLSNGGYVFVVRVPVSFGGPHMVAFKGHGRFYGRNSAGKYPLDVAELRTAFSRSPAVIERAKRFRLDRIDDVVRANVLPFKVVGATLAIHVVPVAALEGGAFDVRRIQGVGMFPVAAAVANSKYNFDGLLTMDNVDHEAFSAYALFFRSGYIESMNSFERKESEPLPMIWIERETISAIRAYLADLVVMEVPPPAVVMVSLLGVRGLTIGGGHLTGELIDREDLVGEPLLVPEYEEWTDASLRPLLDSFWQAAGFAECPHFNAAGGWEVNTSHPF